MNTINKNTPKERIGIDKIFDIDRLEEIEISSTTKTELTQGQRRIHNIQGIHGNFVDKIASLGKWQEEILALIKDEIYNYFLWVYEKIGKTFNRYYVLLKNPEGDDYILVDGQDNISFSQKGEIEKSNNIEISQSNFIKINKDLGSLEIFLKNEEKSSGVLAYGADAMEWCDIGVWIAYSNKKLQLAIIIDLIDENFLDDPTKRKIVTEELSKRKITLIQKIASYIKKEWLFQKHQKKCLSLWIQEIEDDVNREAEKILKQMEEEKNKF